MVRLIPALLLSLALGGNALAAEERAVFAGGCFWCMEEAFERIEGVDEVISGYAGGTPEDATYRRVAAGRTDHAEVIEVRYDPAEVSYRDLLQTFWLNIDPTTPDRQFCDSGRQYRPALFPAGEEQERLARESLALVAIQKPFDAAIRVSIEPLTTFHPAEAYHQDYYRNNALRYRSYKYACGRKQRLEALWGKAEQAFRWPQ